MYFNFQINLLTFDIIIMFLGGPKKQHFLRIWITIIFLKFYSTKMIVVCAALLWTSHAKANTHKNYT